MRRPLRALAPALALALPLSMAACGGGTTAEGPTGPTGPTGPAATLRCAGTAPALPNRLVVGYAGDVGTAAGGGFDVRYMYLAGVLAPDPACLADGRPKAAGCGTTWWGTWQWDQEPPGQYVGNFAAETSGAGLRPMITYYLLLQSAWAWPLSISEGTQEVTVVARNQAFMKAYLDDFRFFLKKLGTASAIVHVEPDFWGYAQHAAKAAGTTAHGLPAKVAISNPTDCAAAEESIAGLGRCMISMARTYAPNALVSLHASAWASGFDCVSNTQASLDVAAEARKTADFLAACTGGCEDLVVADLSDRDAGWYATQQPPRNSWLDTGDAALPTFTQAFTWSKALSDRAGKKAFWWQLPVGNPSLSNTCTSANVNGQTVWTGAWKDNKLDYFFDHPDRVAAGGAAGMAFGAGEACQTTPMTDGGHLAARAKALRDAGGQALP